MIWSLFSFDFPYSHSATTKLPILLHTGSIQVGLSAPSVAEANPSILVRRPDANFLPNEPTSS